MYTSKACYILNHWQLQKIADGIILIGHMHNRTGFPDGSEIMTSSLISWKFFGDSVCFETTNSEYSCNINEYIIESCSLENLLDTSLSGDGKDFPAIIEKVNASLDRRKKTCRSVLRGCASGLVMCWCGCTVPYLKWVAYLSPENIFVNDNVSVSINTSITFSVESKAVRTLSCSSNGWAPAAICSTAGDAAYALNNGPSVLFLKDSNGSILKIDPGKSKAIV